LQSGKTTVEQPGTDDNNWDKKFPNINWGF
jgi:hypothetical protein